MESHPYESNHGCSCRSLERSSRLLVRTRLWVSSKKHVSAGLTNAYPSTVACRYANGTTENIAQISGSPAYLSMMKRLSQPASAHSSPPYTSMEDAWRDAPRELVRKGRKAAGYPASADVGTLSDLLRDLHERAEDHLSQPVPSAVISYTRLAGLYEEDINDAASYLGLMTLRGYHLHQPREIIAAYAGNGMGLCEHYEDVSQCNQEGSALPLRQVLSVQIVHTALVLNTEGVRQALDVADYDTTARADFSDGFDSPERVVASVTSILEERFRFLPHPPEMVVIASGDSANSAILQNVTDAVSSSGPTPRLFALEPLYIAARGAAELAWRAQANVGSDTAPAPSTSLAESGAAAAAGSPPLVSTDKAKRSQQDASS